MIPVTVIGGYLGAGKTTLVNHALRHAGGQRLAILVNEFGALPIDEDLVEATGEDIISIAGGCICCSFGNDLMGALMRLAALDPAPDHILIEASGVAIPASIAASLTLLAQVRLNAIVVLADATTIRAHAADKYLSDTVLRQLREADLVVLTKTDLAAPGSQAELTGWLGARAPGAQVLAAVQGAVPLAVLLGPADREGVPEALPHSDADFDSAVLEPPGPMEPEALRAALAEPEFGVVRAKGFFRGPDGARRLVQAVGQSCEITPAETAGRETLVVIGLRAHLRAEALAARLWPQDSSAPGTAK